MWVAFGPWFCPWCKGIIGGGGQTMRRWAETDVVALHRFDDNAEATSLYDGHGLDVERTHEATSSW